MASGAAQELLPSSVSARSRLDDVAEDDLDASSRCCGGWLLRHDTATTSAGSGSIALTALSASCAPESAVRVADIDFRIARARGRVDSLEGATKRGSGGVGVGATKRGSGGALGVDGSDGATSSAAKQLDDARRELVVALRMRDDAETDRKLAEMRDRRNAQLSELRDSHRHATLFVRVAAWQNVHLARPQMVVSRHQVVSWPRSCSRGFGVGLSLGLKTKRLSSVSRPEFCDLDFDPDANMPVLVSRVWPPVSKFPSRLVSTARHHGVRPGRGLAERGHVPRLRHNVVERHHHDVRHVWRGRRTGVGA